jgi:hypothetical protein
LLQRKDYDLIFTQDHRLVAGQVCGAYLKFRSTGVGELSIKLSDLEMLKNDTGTIPVGAGRFGDPIKWSDTGVLVESEMCLMIRATGEIVHPQFFGVQLATGPHGAIGHHLTGSESRRHYQQEGFHRPGTLVGKIGDQKDHFVIGTHFEGKVYGKGRLYLWVVPWLETEKKTVGSYHVDVAVGALGNDVNNLTPFNKDIVAAFSSTARISF